MNKRIKKLFVCVLVVLAAGICQGVEQPDGNTAAIGRDDPFAGGIGGFGSEQIDIPISTELVQLKPALFVQTVTLKFLRASNLKTALDKMSSEHGSISVDDNTNTLIICDTKESLEKILVEVKKADQTPKQIMIEVVIIDVQLKDDTEIGVDWDFLSTNNESEFYRQSLIYPYRLGITPPTTANIDATTAYQNLGLGSELAIVKNDIRVVVNLLQQKRNVDILASPRVMVVSGQEAEIQTVEQIPYQELTQTSAGGGGSGAITSTQFKDVGVTMKVKATVTDEGKILLVIRPEQSVSTGVSIGGVPVIDKRNASTTLLMDDGQVVVMGGLRRQDRQTIKNKVPLLGDLPLIGFLFSDDRTIVENSELLVFLSPHVYKDEPVPAEAMARYNQLKQNTLITMPADSTPSTSSGQASSPRAEPKPKKSSKK